MIRAFFNILSAIWLVPGTLPAAGQGLTSVRPWMGVAIDKSADGVLVQQVLGGTPAEAAGLKKGDVITRINDTRVSSPDELIQLVTSLGVGNKVTVHYLRNKKPETLSLTLVIKPDSAEIMKKNLLDKAAPEFSLPEVFSGKNISLKDGSGKVTLIMFWATWCPACKQTLPEVEKLARSLGPKLQVLSISDEPSDTQKEYFSKEKPPFMVLSDPGNSLAGNYFVPGLPSFVVVDQKGVVRYVSVGGGSYFLQVAEDVKKLAQ